MVHPLYRQGLSSEKHSNLLISLTQFNFIKHSLFNHKQPNDEAMQLELVVNFEHSF